MTLIRLAALGGIARCPGATTVRSCCKVRFRQRNAGGTPSTMVPSASQKVIRRRWLRESCPIMFPAITAPLLLCLRVCQNLYKSQKYSQAASSCSLVKHKHTIATVIKLQPGEQNIRILFHKDIAPCCCRLHQINTPSSIGNLAAFSENATRQFQAVGARCRALFRLVTVFLVWQVGHIFRIRHTAG